MNTTTPVSDKGDKITETVECVIDCSVPPFCPEGWEILPPEEQIPTRFQSSLKWDMVKQEEARYFFEKPPTGQMLRKGDELRKELVDQNIVVLPANVLDFLLANEHLIPEEWKHKSIFFWGTIYCSEKIKLMIRYLCWGSGSWGWHTRYCFSYFPSRSCVALPAS